MSTAPRQTTRSNPQRRARQASLSPDDSRPRSPNQRGDDLLMVARRLSDVLVKENTALRKHNVQQVREITPQKEDLAKLYQRQLLAFHKDPKLIAQMDEGRRSALKTMGERLSELMRDNASLLRANIESINRLVKIVVDTVKEQKQETASAYGANGAIGAYEGNRRDSALAYSKEL